MLLTSPVLEKVRIQESEPESIHAFQQLLANSVLLNVYPGFGALNFVLNHSLLSEKKKVKENLLYYSGINLPILFTCNFNQGVEG